MAWHAKATGAYSRHTTEAQENAIEAYGLLNSFGYSLESVCALLGNQAGESGYNPWRWGSDNVLASDSPWIDQREPIPGTQPVRYYNHAYGLFQQDPAGKYLHRQYAMSLPSYAPNYSNAGGLPYDGDAQIRYLHWICSDPNGGEWVQTGTNYDMSYYNFYTNRASKGIEWLTRTFFYCYERGTWSDLRIRDANYWLDFLGGITPPTPPSYGKKFPLIFYMKKHPF